jgi:hypothetical protein
MVIEDIGYEPGPAGLMHRPTSLRLPTDGLIKIVFVDVLIDLGFAPCGWAMGGEISGGWVGSPMGFKILTIDSASVTNAMIRMVAPQVVHPSGKIS